MATHLKKQNKKQTKELKKLTKSLEKKKNEVNKKTEKTIEELIKELQMAPNARGKDKRTGLTNKQELFCLFYSWRLSDTYGNGTQSYIKAYNIDITERGAYNGARASAAETLAKPSIIKRCNEIMDNEVLNHVFVDSQLAFLISQNADLKVKLGAIAEYNSKEGRKVSRVRIEPPELPDDNDGGYAEWKKQQAKKVT